MATSRRAFLIEMFSASVVAQIPASILDQPITVNWQAALTSVLADWQRDYMLYGIAAIEYTNEFPYVKTVDLKALLVLTDIERSNRGM